MKQVLWKRCKGSIRPGILLRYASAKIHAQQCNDNQPLGSQSPCCKNKFESLESYINNWQCCIVQKKFTKLSEEDKKSEIFRLAFDLLQTLSKIKINFHMRKPNLFEINQLLSVFRLFKS